MTELVFDSEIKVLNVDTNIEINVHYNVLRVVRSIADIFPNKEFSVLFQGYELTVSDRYVIPRQEVTGASVDFLDEREIVEYKRQGYNVLLHVHPWSGANQFSYSDFESLNDFDINLLSDGEEITSAYVPVITNGVKLLLVTRNIKVFYDDIEVQGVDNIDVKTENTKFKFGIRRYIDDDYLLW